MKTFAIITDLHIRHVAKKLRVFKNNFLKNLKADCLIIAGDIAGGYQSEIEEVFKVIYETRPDLLVFVVFGNHDWWDGDKAFSSIVEIDYFHKEMCKKYNIHYLQNNKYEDDDLVLYGFDGWYRYQNPPTNDKSWMPANGGMGELTPFQVLQREEGFALDYILDDLRDNPTEKTKVLVTHFNVTEADHPTYAQMTGNTRITEFLCPDFDYLIFGHTHQKFEDEISGCKLINVGADYDHSPSLKYPNRFYKILKFCKIK